VQANLAEENLNIIMLICITIALGFILYEIIFRKYRSVIFFSTGKVTSKVFSHLILKDMAKKSIVVEEPEVIPPPSMILSKRPGFARNFNEMEAMENEKELQKKRTMRRKAVLAHFQFLGNKVMTLLKCVKVLHNRNNISTEHLHNPHIPKYFSNTFLWFVIYAIVLILKPTFDEDSGGYSIDIILANLQSTQGRLLAFMIALFILLDNFENNRYRRNNYRSILNTDFKSLKAKILFQLEGLVPFYLELKTVLAFISSKTSLGLYKWYQIENIKRILLTAKFINEAEKKKIIGFAESKPTKLIVGGVFLFILFALAVAPFWAFSNVNPLVHLPLVKRANLFLEIAFAENNYNQMNKFVLVELNSLSVQGTLNEELRQYQNGISKSELGQIIVNLSENQL
jgi:hypothetical protein